MSEIAKLLERVKALAGPDRVADRAIAKHFKIGWDYGADWPTIIDDDGEKTSEPTAFPYTASIDAALALTERVLPGCKKSLTELVVGWSASVLIVDNKHPEFVAEDFHADAATAPLALIAAVLTALQDQRHEQ